MLTVLKIPQPDCGNTPLKQRVHIRIASWTNSSFRGQLAQTSSNAFHKYLQSGAIGEITDFGENNVFIFSFSDSKKSGENFNIVATSDILYKVYVQPQKQSKVFQINTN